MYTRTAQPGLWFIAGSLAQSRINSKYLALQIKAVEVGLLDARVAADASQNSHVIPGRAKREPGIHNHDREYGFRACAKQAHPGMTKKQT